MLYCCEEVAQKVESKDIRYKDTFFIDLLSLLIQLDSNPEPISS